MYAIFIDFFAVLWWNKVKTEWDEIVKKFKILNIIFNVIERKLLLKSKIRKYLFSIHYYLLPEILNVSLVKSEKWKSKNPERCRIQDFLAPPVGLEPDDLT